MHLIEDKALLSSTYLLNCSPQRTLFAQLCLLTLWQPTLLLHNQHTASYTPSSPAQCPELARNHLTNVAGIWVRIGDSRIHMCSYPHKQEPTHTDTHRWHSKCTEDIYSNLKTKTWKQSQLSKVINWLEVCFAPNACFSYFDSPLNYFMFSLLHSAPNSSPTCFTNCRGMFGLLNVWKYFLNQSNFCQHDS